jgi:3-hydroxybutyryl-CoA dehydrogenase
MGAGIAELGALGGIETLLYDSKHDALDAGLSRIDSNLADAVARGSLSRDEAAEARARLRRVTSAETFADCQIVIEAVPEDLDTKIAVLRALPPDSVLATNTSSLSVASIAACVQRPERIVGMHFFNPPGRMPLVELIAGPDTSAVAVGLARATALAMGRTPITAQDSVGFVVNRCARPFYAEALALLEDGLATPSEIDRICRLGGPFRMGPFELMDLVGLDTGLAVARSFTEASFGEPRWRPSRELARMVDAGRLGRKSGRGWYDYANNRYRPDDEAAPTGNGGSGRQLAVLGGGVEAHSMRARAIAHGFVVTPTASPGDAPAAILDFRAASERSRPAQAVPIAVTCGRASLAASGQPEAIGFHVLPPVEEAMLIELTRLPGCAPEHASAIEEIASAMGLATTWVEDSPGLVLGRIVCQLVNEACFAATERVATPADIDLALRLGLNHPHGPIAWGERIGWASVLARIDGLWDDRHDPRYRAAPLLRRAVATGRSVRELADARPRSTDGSVHG